MTAIDVRAVLDLADLPAEHRIRGLLSQVLARTGELPPHVDHDERLWPASFHGLDKAPAWLEAPPMVQDTILRAANRALLEEAWFIEKAGLAFAAKMVLLARNTQERMLYSLFAADEARHFASISAWVHETPVPTAFHALLAEAIEDGHRAVLVVLIQVVLEGWGLKHYRHMATHTTHPELRALLEQILADEAFHHGSGTLISSDQPLSATEQAQAVDYLERFFAMIRPGPLGVASLLCEHTSLSAEQALHQLDAQQHARSRLDVLFGLLGTQHLRPLRDELASRGCFQPTEAP